MVRFICESQELGEMTKVRKSDFSMSAFAKKSQREASVSLDYSLPLSPLLVVLREETNVQLLDMGENLSVSFLPRTSSSRSEVLSS